MKNHINKIKKIVLVGGDILVLWLALGLTLVIRYGEMFNERVWQAHFWPFVIVYAVWLLIFFIGGLYDLGAARNSWRFYNNLFRVLFWAGAVSAALFYLVPVFGITPKTNLVLDIAIFAVLFSFWRNLFNHWAKFSRLHHRVLIIGKTKEAEELAHRLKKRPQLGYKVQKIADLKDIKTVFHLTETIVKEKINTVVVAVRLHKNPDLVKSLYDCLPLKVCLTDLPNFYEKITGKVPVSVIEEMWFLENLMNRQKDFYEAAKRGFDFVFGLVLFLVTAPLYPLIALAIKLNSRGSVFYSHKRVGQNGKIFDILKFRSMVADAEKDGAQWTTIGRFLRATHLDELPQAINILKGDISFVGPRPERPEFAFDNNTLAKLPFYQIRHLVKPGATGWALIKFRYSGSVEETLEKLQYDLYYIKNRSFALDLAIILRTFKIVLSRQGR